MNFEPLASRRVAFLVNQASVTNNMRHLCDAALESGVDIRFILTPEHGFFGNFSYMEPVSDGRYRDTDIPIYSLYGEDESSIYPDENLLIDIDVVVCDLPDVGTRFYTYASTMAAVMEVCAKVGREMFVLDRPNPITGLEVEGGKAIANEYRSFVGYLPVAIRHGMTIGELAYLYNEEKCNDLDLTIVRMDNWQRKMWFDQTGLRWVAPSPNMPSPETALFYPGMCLLEGTNISEGRGTTRPFKIFGAPFIDAYRLSDALNSMGLFGVIFRPIYFTPGFDKFEGQLCGGCEIHIVNRKSFNSVKTGLAIIAKVREMYPEDFVWRTQEYEFKDDVPAFDLLTGDSKIREMIDSGMDFEKIYAEINRDLYNLNDIRKQYLIYN